MVITRCHEAVCQQTVGCRQIRLGHDEGRTRRLMFAVTSSPSNTLTSLLVTPDIVWRVMLFGYVIIGLLPGSGAAANEFAGFTFIASHAATWHRR